MQCLKAQLSRKTPSYACFRQNESQRYSDLRSCPMLRIHSRSDDPLWCCRWNSRIQSRCQRLGSERIWSGFAGRILHDLRIHRRSHIDIHLFACDLRINYQESPSRFRRHFHWSKPCPHPPRRDPDNGHVCEPRKKPRPSSRGGWYSFEPALAILGRPDCRRTHRCTGLAPAGIMITPTLTRFHGNGLSDIYIY